MVYMNYDDTINDPNATKLQRKLAKSSKKQQEKRKRYRAMGLTADGKPRKRQYSKQIKTGNGARIYYQRVPTEEGYCTGHKVTVVGNDVTDSPEEEDDDEDETVTRGSNARAKRPRTINLNDSDDDDSSDDDTPDWLR